jgi:hypothetical protein
MLIAGLLPSGCTPVYQSTDELALAPFILLALSIALNILLIFRI